MKNLFRTALALASAFALFASAANASCSTDTPLSVWGQGGSNGLIASTGTPNTYDSGSVVGQITNDLNDLDGTAHLSGTADCSDAFNDLRREMRDAQSETAAIAAALSAPVWLETGENFAISGGLGLSDGTTALGATGVFRLGKGFSGFAGGAVSTENSDAWAGKVGVRAAW